MNAEFSQKPLQIATGSTKPIHIFEKAGSNIDDAVVQAFGEEWLKFNNFSAHDVKQFGDEYFDIAPPGMLNPQTYVLDVGCGSGRFSKYLSSQVGFIEAIDPSDAIWAAEKLLADTPNVRLSKAAADDIPFADNTFDLVMSIGVLHHIPDTAAAMQRCVQKVKPGGHFFVYLYYNLDNRGFIFKSIFKTISVIRRFVSTRSAGFKKILCDIIAVLVYMPVILLGRLFNLIGLKKAAEALPLSYYQDKSFFVIRNDALDRFGTRLEHRFTKQEITAMMQGAGLTDIVFSPNKPYWHAIGRRQ